MIKVTEIAECGKAKSEFYCINFPHSPKVALVLSGDHTNRTMMMGKVIMQNNIQASDRI
jgi:hypothetical protein